ncbi:hypothetical protein IKE67_03680 [bacterium]|nr:hypothetical protein [bacterium]
MKKNQIIILCLLAILASDGVYAAEVSKNFNAFGIKVSTPSETAESVAQKRVNMTAMKAQIVSIKSKINATSSVYNSTLDSLANNLLPAEQLKKYNEQKESAKNGANSKKIFGIEITQDETSCLNKFLKSYSSKDTFNRLTIAQKLAVKTDLLALKSVSGSYKMIVEQAKTLTQHIKANSAVALELKSDITDLVKMQYSVTTKSKAVDKLIDNLINSASNAGFNL